MRKRYALTAEHRAQLKPWADRWIANALSTAAMTDEDRAACREAVAGMYAAAGLPTPRVVFVASPFAAAFASGHAAAWWYRHRNNADAVAAAHAATDAAAATAAATAAVVAATYLATDAAATATATAAVVAAVVAAAATYATYATDDAAATAIRAAAHAATYSATVAAATDAAATAIHAATAAAVVAATYSATVAAATDAAATAIYAATHTAVVAATHAAVAATTAAAIHAATAATVADAATDEFWHPVGNQCAAASPDQFSTQCAALAWKFRQGGNHWSAWDSYLSFFQDIAGLELPGCQAYRHWRTLSERSGPRYVHKEFCIISDRPELLTVDAENRPHADTGPFCRWRDGTALYAVHGVRVKWWIMEHPEWITVAKIDAEENTEIRRVMVERYGPDRFIRDSRAQAIDHDERWGTLYRREIAGDEPLLMIEVVNRSPESDGTFRRYMLRVPPATKTALEAVAWTFGMQTAEYARLKAES